jgi:uncharacterized caspase-like protein
MIRLYVRPGENISFGLGLAQRAFFSQGRGDAGESLCSFVLKPPYCFAVFPSMHGICRIVDSYSGGMMPRVLRAIIRLLLLLLPGLVAAQSAPDAEKRIAVVIGNISYQGGTLSTPANDAGLIAQTLEAAGFDVVGARDLDQDSLRRTFRDFLDKAQASGPNTVAFIYLSGYGLQLEGENYFVPVDAKIARDSDVAAQAIRINDYLRALGALKLRTTIVVLDAARASPFAQSDTPLPGGLALVEPESGMLIAFNAAPDTVAPEGQGPYGPYAQALAEMIREGGLPLADVFDRVRLRVNDVTQGAEVPWHASKVQAQYVFFERAPDAPPPAVSYEQTAAIRDTPIQDLGAQEAYLAALDRDTLQGYLDFLAAYPDDSMANRVRAIVSARREAITWRRTRVVDTPSAYWSYLRRYPHGRHAAEAHHRLAFLAAALEPPPAFVAIDYEVTPPPPQEFVYIERRVLIFDDPLFGFAPPPPPVIFLAPPPREFVLLPPPPAPVALFVLPIPVFTPVPVWVRAPAYVAPPPANNVIFNNIHNTVVINNVTNTVTITNPSGQTTTVSPPAQPAAAAAGTRTGTPAPAAMGPTLPPSVAQKAITTRSPTAPGPSPQAGVSGQQQTHQPAQSILPGQPLPGLKGLPLPLTKGAPPTATGPSGQQPAPPTQQGALPATKGQSVPLIKGAAPIAGGQPQAQQPGQSVGQQTAPATQQGATPAIRGQSAPLVKGAPLTSAGQPHTQQSGQSIGQQTAPATQQGTSPATKGQPLLTKNTPPAIAGQPQNLQSGQSTTKQSSPPTQAGPATPAHIYKGTPPSDPVSKGSPPAAPQPSAQQHQQPSQASAANKQQKNCGGHDQPPCP